MNKRPAPTQKHTRNDKKKCTPELPCLVAPAVLAPADPEAATAGKESPRLPLLVPKSAPAPLAPAAPQAAPALVSVPAGVTATNGGEVADGASSAVPMNTQASSEISSPTEMPEADEVDYDVTPPPPDPRQSGGG